MQREVYQYIFHKLRPRLLVLSAMTVILGISYYFEHEIIVILNRYKSDYERINDQKYEMHNVVERIEEATKLWNSGLNSLYEDRKGIDVDFAKRSVYGLHKKYGFKDFSVSITDPNINKNFTGLQYVAIESSVLNITFNALSDLDVLEFIKDLKDTLPGIVVDLYMEMRLNNVSSSLDVKIVMLWQNFLDKGDDE
jgi:hypothetical protein